MHALRMRAWPAAGAALLAALPFAARAQVYKCPQANGTIAFQSTPCPGAAAPTTRPSLADLNAHRVKPAADGKAYDDPYANDVRDRPRAGLPPQSPPVAPAAPAPGGAPDASASSRLVADVQARNKAENQRQAYAEAHRRDMTPARQYDCNTARHNLGVLKEQRPVFTYDNKGDKRYVEDKDRAAALAQAEGQVASNCN